MYEQDGELLHFEDILTNPIDLSLTRINNTLSYMIGRCSGR